MRLLPILIVTAVCLSTAAPARAQMKRGDLWIEGRFVSDRDKDNGVIRTTNGGGAAVGVALLPDFGLQVVIDRTDGVEPFEPNTSPATRTRDTGFIGHRRSTFSVLADAHAISTNRLRLTLSGGMAREFTTTRLALTTEHLSPAGDVTSRETLDGATSRSSDILTFGFEAPLRILRGFYVVPSVRAYTRYTDYGWQGFVRPSIGVRWAL